jgi:hypothetical protein
MTTKGGTQAATGCLRDRTLWIDTRSELHPKKEGKLTLFLDILLSSIVLPSSRKYIGDRQFVLC